MTFEQWWRDNQNDLFAAALGARTHSDTITLKDITSLPSNPDEDKVA